MKKNKTPSYVLTLKLKTEKYQENIINKRLEIARNISNALTNKVLKRYNLMLESKEYMSIKKQLNPVNKNYHNSDNIKSKKIFEKQRKELYKQLEELYLKYDLSQYSLYNDVKPMYKHFKDNTRTQLTISKELKQQLEKIAKEQNRSFNNLVITILQKYIDDSSHH